LNKAKSISKKLIARQKSVMIFVYGIKNNGGQCFALAAVNVLFNDILNSLPAACLPVGRASRLIQYS